MSTIVARRRTTERVSMVLVTVMLVATVFAPTLCAQTVPTIGGQAQPSTGTQAAGLAAQASQPYRGLFGAGSAAAPGGRILSWVTVVSEEYSRNENSVITAASPVLTEGWFTGVQSTLAFQKAWRYTKFGLSGDGSFRYYSATRQTTLPRFRVNFGLDHRTGPTRQNTVSVTATADYQPYYTLAIIQATPSTTEAVAIVPTSRDDGLFRQESYVYAETFAFQRQLSRRTYVSVAEAGRYTKSSTSALDVSSVNAVARFGARLSESSSLRLGYSYQTGRYGVDSANRLESNGLELSLDVHKALTRSRGTTFGLSTGMTRVKSATSAPWTVVGTVNLRHEVGAGWFIQGDFVRNTQLIEGFADPLAVNTAALSVGGFLVRRLEWQASGAYSKGTAGSRAARYEAYQGSTRLRLALARYIAIDVEGLLYGHDLAASVAALPQVPTTLNRWVARCNLALWIPLAR